MRQWLQSAESTANDGPMNSGPIEPFNFSDLPNLIDLLPLEEVDKDRGLPKHTLGRQALEQKGRKTFSAGKQAAGKEERDSPTSSTGAGGTIATRGENSS